MSEQNCLKWYNKVGYGSGDIAGNVVYSFLSAFMMFYLTETVGMNLGIVGVLMALSKLLDSVTDLFFGSWIDKTHTKLGKARPWMLFGYIGCALMLIAIFMVPESWNENAQYVYFFITYTLLNAVFFTANNIAYAALVALITKNPAERVQLGSFRFIFASATSMIIQMMTITLVESFGGGSAGWKRIAILYAVLGLVSNTISALSVKELPEEESTESAASSFAKQDETYPFLESLKLIISNKYYLMICSIYLLSQLCQSAMNMGIYFMKYILGDAELLGSFSFAMNGPMMVGLLLTPLLVRKMRGMFRINLIGYSLAILGRIGVLIASFSANVPLMLLFTAAASLGTSPLNGDLNALIASCSEYTFLTKGKHIDGSMYSCSSFGIKVGGSIGTAITGWLMSCAGFVENAAAQPQSAIAMLNFLYLWVPILFYFAIMLVLSRLTVEKANETLLAKTR